MQIIKTKEDWDKVGKLGWKWYSKIGGWNVPTKILILGAGAGILLTWLNIRWQWLFWCCLTLLFGRTRQVEGYVDGWNQAQDFVTSDITIDELLEFDQSKEPNLAKKGKTT